MEKKLVAASGLTGLIGSRIEELLGGNFRWLSLRYEDGFDITSGEKVDRAISSFKGEAVLHLAAFTDLNAANKERGDKTGMCYQINVLGTRNIARACQKNDKYLIHVSTDAVFGGDKKLQYAEEDAPGPIEWYGKTKFWAEEEVKQSGASAAIVRFAYPFRAGFELKKDFVGKIIDQLKNREKISMFGDTMFTPTFIDDIAPALSEILINKPTGIFHVVGSTPLSPLAAAFQVARTFGLDETLIREKRIDDYLASGGRPYPRYAALSNEKLKRELGISMKTFPNALLEMKRQVESSRK